MKIFPVLAIVASLAATVAAMPLTAAPSGRISGDYVEARTASVFCGACHYNGELVTTGREALMAWNFNTGSYHGVDIAGLHAMAAITCDDNISIDTAARTTEIAIDPAASSAQAAAITEIIRTECGKQIGAITGVRRATITFSHNDDGYQVNAPGFATMTVSYRTDNACCVMPGLVWYDPISPIEGRKVGFTEMAAFSGSLDHPWERRGEDSAFYGAFAY